MCGIAGYTSNSANNTPHDEQILSDMLARIYWRGPDSEGRFLSPQIALGMRRLAILDIEGGNQPFQDPVSGVTLVFNGEIYNYLELGASLRKKGYKIRSHCDTEVLLHSYLEYGQAFVDQLNGMFAIAVWDPRQKILLLARDHLGQKPLYYWTKGNELVFGSDLRSILAHPSTPDTLNKAALTDFLRYRHIPANSCIIKDIQQLPAGHLFIHQLDKESQQLCYWQPDFVPNPELDAINAIELFNQQWPKAVQRHLHSEVPLGAFLSGGIDSCLVVKEAVKLSPKLKTFSISFSDSAYDETVYAQQTAHMFGCEHHVIPFKASLEPLLKEWLQAYDQPFSDPACFPMLILAREARREVTVALTGDGGDELFAGYQRYRSAQLSRKLTRLPRPIRQHCAGAISAMGSLLPSHLSQRRLIDAVARRLALVQDDASDEYLQQFWCFNEQQLSDILAFPPTTSLKPVLKQTSPRLFVENMLKHDLENWLPDQMLVKIDRATMAHSLETRSPFLDRQIVELALQIPSKTHFQAGDTKHILRTTAAQQLPPSISRRPKQGFAVPVDRMLRNNSDYISDLFNSELPRHETLFNTNGILQYWKEHQRGLHNHGERLLSLIIFLNWYKNMFQPGF